MPGPFAIFRDSRVWVVKTTAVKTMAVVDSLAAPVALGKANLTTPGAKGKNMADGDRAALLAAHVGEPADGTVTVRLSGEIDMSTADILSEHLRAVSTQRLENVILDATEVSFMDSTGLHALTEGKRIIHEGGARLFLVPSAQVRRVLDLVFPEPLFAVRVDSAEEALALIAPGSGKAAGS